MARAARCCSNRNWKFEGSVKIACADTEKG